jgi:hypothetical protein
MTPVFPVDIKRLNEAFATRRMPDRMLAVKEKHADDLAGLLETLSTHFPSVRRA